MKKRIALAIASGVLLIFSFPPFGLGFLAWLAFVPLFFALGRGAGLKSLFFTGLTAGFIFYTGTVYWVVNSMFFYGGVPIYISVPVMLALALYLGLYTGVFAVFAGATEDMSGLARLVLLPSVWVGLEYLRAHLLSGFPWVLLGYSQVPYLPLIQIADVTGVWGISFVVIAVNTAFFLFAKAVLEKRGPLPARELIIAFALAAAVFSYGHIRIKQVEGEFLTWRGLRVGVAQGSIEQSLKWDASFQGATMDIYRDLTKKSSQLGANLVVWPESAAPFFVTDGSPETALVGNIARESNVFVLTGIASYTKNYAQRTVDFFNSAVIFSPSGELTGKYDKIHLVPFGEYVPLKRFLPFVKKLTAGAGDFKEGPGPVPLKFLNDGVGMLICYEAIFPEIARGAIKNGAVLLVNITNDAWFGKSSAPYQHFEMSLMRAVENRAFLLRAANTGISGIIDPVGRVRSKLGLFERGSINGVAGLRSGGQTLYTAYGDIFAYWCLGVTGALAVMIIFKRRS